MMLIKMIRDFPILQVDKREGASSLAISGAHRTERNFNLRTLFLSRMSSGLLSVINQQHFPFTHRQAGDSVADLVFSLRKSFSLRKLRATLARKPSPFAHYDAAAVGSRASDRQIQNAGQQSSP